MSFLLDDVAERLKSERKRLGYTQKQIAEAIGISEPSWNRYEKYSAAFDVQVILALHEQGFDVVYVLFGTRQVQDMLMISDDFLKVYTLYNQLDSKEKALLIDMIELFLKSTKKE